jgi:hypothetical protein
MYYKILIIIYLIIFIVIYFIYEYLNSDKDNIEKIPDIKYVCSLGSVCQASHFLKKNDLKKTSYPFDWIYTNLDNVIECIENDFNIFLDKKYYIDNTPHGCGHKIYNNPYHHIYWRHRNPLVNDDDYKYVVRCVERFRSLLKYQEKKLFMITIIDGQYDVNTKINEKFINNLISFNNRFKKHTSNYILLVIVNYPYKEKNNHTITKYDEIDLLEVDTYSISYGKEFEDPRDGSYLDSIIKDRYNFDLLPL